MYQDPRQKILCVIEKLREECELCPDGVRELDIPASVLMEGCDLDFYQLKNVLNKLQREGLIDAFSMRDPYNPYE